MLQTVVLLEFKRLAQILRQLSNRSVECLLEQKIVVFVYSAASVWRNIIKFFVNGFVLCDIALLALGHFHHMMPCDSEEPCSVVPACERFTLFKDHAHHGLKCVLRSIV